MALGGACGGTVVISGSAKKKRQKVESQKRISLFCFFRTSGSSGSYRNPLQGPPPSGRAVTRPGSYTKNGS